MIANCDKPRPGISPRVPRKKDVQDLYFETFGYPRYDGQTCLSDCPYLVFVRMQKLKLTTITVPRHRCSHYDQNLVYVMGLGPDRCLECMESIV